MHNTRFDGPGFNCSALSSSVSKHRHEEVHHARHRRSTYSQIWVTIGMTSAMLAIACMSKRSAHRTKLSHSSSSRWVSCLGESFRRLHTTATQKSQFRKTSQVTDWSQQASISDTIQGELKILLRVNITTDVHVSKWHVIMDGAFVITVPIRTRVRTRDASCLYCELTCL